jgi:hypothetical protein
VADEFSSYSFVSFILLIYSMKDSSYREAYSYLASQENPCQKVHYKSLPLTPFSRNLTLEHRMKAAGK